MVIMEEPVPKVENFDHLSFHNNSVLRSIFAPMRQLHNTVRLIEDYASQKTYSGSFQHNDDLANQTTDMSISVPVSSGGICLPARGIVECREADHSKSGMKLMRDETMPPSSSAFRSVSHMFVR